MRKATSRRFAKNFLLFTAATFSIGSAIFALLFHFPNFCEVFGHPYGAVYRMFLYHWKHPHQYWLIMSLAFAFTSTLWVALFASRSKRTRWITSLLSIPIAVLLASIPGSMLWAYHDMQAGHFHGWPGSLAYMVQWIPTGVVVGQILLLNSIPFNVIVSVLAVTLLNRWGTKLR